MPLLVFVVTTVFGVDERFFTCRKGRKALQSARPLLLVFLAFGFDDNALSIGFHAGGSLHWGGQCAMSPWS
eukprot:1161418-Pelagomonas_calceolata.AAC.2